MIGEGGDEARARAKTARGQLAGLAIAVGGSSQLLGAPCVARGATMASLWAYRREDWPGTCLWRVFIAPIYCRRLSPACYLGPIAPDMGWGEGLDVHLELPLTSGCCRPIDPYLI